MSAREHALAMLAWARLWSPLGDDTAREQAWTALGLPGSFGAIGTEYWTLCHGPEARLPLLLHAALGREGAAVREELLRVMDYLALDWDGCHLPPDQLGVVCELLGCALDAGEPVLARELCARYLRPWCEAALARVPAETAMAAVLGGFRADLDLVPPQ